MKNIAFINKEVNQKMKKTNIKKVAKNLQCTENEAQSIANEWYLLEQLVKSL